jgi:cysteine-S-conjugate beta-lyase
MDPRPDFDAAIERRGTNCYKWDRRPVNAAGDPLLPMWVADMDFACAPAIQRALDARITHPVYGYTFESPDDRRVFCEWQRDRNGWTVDERWLLQAPSVMPAVRAAILAFAEPGDEVIIQTPVYYPFFDAIRANGRSVLVNPLVEETPPGGGAHDEAHRVRYRMDLEHLEKAITPRTRILLLCSPHNPVGRVWTLTELTELADICVRHDLVVISDEIHSDIRRSGTGFIPFTTVGPEIASRTIACHSVTKTFNLAGIASAQIVVPDDGLRTRLQATFERLGLTLPNALSLAAARAAYGESADWVDALMRYLDDQIDWFTAAIADRVPAIGMSSIEGTYLAWLDFRRLLSLAGATHREAERTLLEDVALRLSDGTQFGENGEGFFRMNLAAPRAVVADGFDRLVRAVRLLEGRA